MMKSSTYAAGRWPLGIIAKVCEHFQIYNDTQRRQVKGSDIYPIIRPPFFFLIDG